MLAKFSPTHSFGGPPRGCGGVGEARRRFPQSLDGEKCNTNSPNRKAAATINGGTPKKRRLIDIACKAIPLWCGLSTDGKCRLPDTRNATKRTACAPLGEVDTTVAAKAVALSETLRRGDQNGKTIKIENALRKAGFRTGGGGVVFYNGCAFARCFICKRLPPEADPIRRGLYRRDRRNPARGARPCRRTNPNRRSFPTWDERRRIELRYTNWRRQKS